jgi:hypothetical protein
LGDEFYELSDWLGLYSNPCAAHNEIMRNGDIIPDSLNPLNIHEGRLAAGDLSFRGGLGLHLNG